MPQVQLILRSVLSRVDCRLLVPISLPHPNDTLLSRRVQVLTLPQRKKERTYKINPYSTQVSRTFPTFEHPPSSLSIIIIDGIPPHHPDSTGTHAPKPQNRQITILMSTPDPSHGQHPNQPFHSICKTFLAKQRTVPPAPPPQWRGGGAGGTVLGRASTHP